MCGREIAGDDDVAEMDGDKDRKIGTVGGRERRDGMDSNNRKSMDTC